MRPPDLFRHCPRCGAAQPTPGANPLRCGGCGLVYYFNPTVAAAAFVFDGSGRCLFIRRAENPAKGKLAVPGGFIDAGESAEEAVRRETMEEVGVELVRVGFLGSWPNVYPYQGVEYPVVDLIFRAEAVNPAAARPLDAVAGIEWRRPADVDPDELAFPSLKMGIRLL